MFCTGCAKELPADAAACPACGLAVAGANTAKKSSNGCLIAGIVAVAGVGFVAIVGIIAAIAIPNFLNAVDRGKQKRTRADAASIVFVVERHLERTGSYPVAESMEELVGATAEDGGEKLPLVDGWERPFWVTSGPAGFELVSFGKDGEPDAIPLDENTSFNADLLWFGDAPAIEPEVGQDAEPEGES